MVIAFIGEREAASGSRKFAFHEIARLLTLKPLSDFMTLFSINITIHRVDVLHT